MSIDDSFQDPQTPNTDSLDQLSLQRLSEPIGTIAYGESGSVDLENGNYRMHIAYKRASPSYGQLQITDTTLELVSFSLSRTDTNAKLELSDIVPPNAIVLFNPASETGEGFAYTGWDRPLIVATGNITQPNTVLTVLHEAGHLFKDPGVDVGDINARRAYMKDDAKLERERNSWTDVLRKLKPLLDRRHSNEYSILLEDVMRVIKKDLRKYDKES